MANTIIDQVLGFAAALEAPLAAAGTSAGNIESAVAQIASALEGAAASGVEQVALDALEAAFPQLKLFVAVAEAAIAAAKILDPQIRPAGLDDPVFKTQDANPYSRTGPLHSNGD